MSTSDIKCDEVRMRRALYRLMWDRVEAGKKTPQPCPALSDENISRELYSILASAGVRRLSVRAAAFIVTLLFIVIAMPALALLVRLCVWITGF